MKDTQSEQTGIGETVHDFGGSWFNWPIDRIGFFLGPALMLGWMFLGPQGELSTQAHTLFGILLLTVTWWLTEPIPIPVTGLAAVIFAVVLGCVPTPADAKPDPAKVVLASFAEPSVVFLMGGMFIGHAMTRHGLDRRFALSILCANWVGRSPATVLLAVGLSVTSVSMFISNTAATAMVYPVTMGIIGALAAAGADAKGNAGDFARSPFASGLLLMTAYASSVGGIATPMGTATNVVAMGLFNKPEILDRKIDFFRWSAVGVPMMAIIFVGLYFWLRRLSPARDLNLIALREFLVKQRAQLGPWKAGEWNTLIVFILVVGLWITPGVLTFVNEELEGRFSMRFPEAIVALAAPVLLFMLPVSWKRREFTLEPADLLKVDWGTTLLFGSGLALGGLMFSTGLAKAVGQGAFAMLPSTDLWLITALAVGGGIILSEFTSNAATATTLIPVVSELCKQAGVDAIPPLMGVTFGASFGSALPVSTPPNAIVYGSGLLPVKRMIVAGIGVDVVCWVVIFAVLFVAYHIGWQPF